MLILNGPGRGVTAAPASCPLRPHKIGDPAGVVGGGSAMHHRARSTRRFDASEITGIGAYSGGLKPDASASWAPCWWGTAAPATPGVQATTHPLEQFHHWQRAARRL